MTNGQDLLVTFPTSYTVVTMNLLDTSTPSPKAISYLMVRHLSSTESIKTLLEIVVLAFGIVSQSYSDPLSCFSVLPVFCLYYVSSIFSATFTPTPFHLLRGQVIKAFLASNVSTSLRLIEVKTQSLF